MIDLVFDKMPIVEDIQKAKECLKIIMEQEKILNDLGFKITLVVKQEKPKKYDLL